MPWLFAATALLAGCGSGYRFSGATSGTAVAVAAGPQLGYFWNAADSTLRPVLGIAGASQVGSSVVSAGLYRTGAGSAVSGLGVVQEQDGSLDVLTLPSGAPVHLLASTASGATIRFSPGGTAALVFAPGASSATVVTGLGAANTVRDLPLPATVQDAAVSDAGHLALYVGAGAGSTLEVLGVGSSPVRIASVGAPGGVAFGPGDTLYFADAAASTAYRVANASTTPATAALATASLLHAPAALGISGGGRWLLVSNGGESSVVRLDLQGQAAPLRIACACAPTSAVPLAGNGAFRLTEPNGGPLWAADLNGDTPRTFFIPALP